MKTKIRMTRVILKCVFSFLAGVLVSGNILAAELHGMVDFGTRVQIVAPGKGQVVAVNAKVGDIVEAGAVVVELDSRIQQAALKIQQARVDRISIELQELEAEHERNLELYDRGSLSTTDFESVERQVKQTRLKLVEAEAKRRIVEVKLERTKLVAPFDAYVETMDVVEGMYLTRRIDPQVLMTLAKFGDLVIRVPVSYDVMRGLLNVSEVNVRFEGSDRLFSAQVEPAISPSEIGSTYPYVFRMNYEDRFIYPGTPATIVYEPDLAN